MPMHARTATGPYAHTRRLRPRPPLRPHAPQALVEAKMANAEALLDSDWLQWSATLLRAVGANQPEEEAAALRAQLYGFASHVLLRDMMSSDRQRCRTPTSPSRVTPLCHTSVSHLCAPPPICPRMPSSGILPLTSRGTPHTPCRCHLSKLGDVHDAEPFQLGLLGAPLTLTLAARCAPNPNPSC